MSSSYRYCPLLPSVPPTEPTSPSMGGSARRSFSSGVPRLAGQPSWAPGRSADHVRDVVSSWRPNRGRGVYHAVRDALDGKNWEYCTVVEKHRNGYGHAHVCSLMGRLLRVTSTTP